MHFELGRPCYWYEIPEQRKLKIWHLTVSVYPASVSADTDAAGFDPKYNSNYVVCD